MIFQITDTIRLASDSRSWMLQEARLRKHRRTGEQITAWEPIRWYGSLQGAVQGLGEHLLRTSDAVGVAEAMAEVKKLVATLSPALAPQFDVAPRSHANQSGQHRGRPNGP